jgi:pimeloyl-ACP methyl ester carboxylesterase
VVSLLVAAERPQLVERLVLMGAAATFDLKFKRPPASDDEAEFAALIDDANRRAAPLFFTAHHPEVAARVTACWSTITPAVHRSLSGLRHPDLRDVTRRTAPPVLLIAGEHDRCTTADQARWMHAHLPDSELYVVPGTAHFMYLEEPELVASRILEFLGAA